MKPTKAQIEAAKIILACAGVRTTRKAKKSNVLDFKAKFEKTMVTKGHKRLSIQEGNYVNKKGLTIPVKVEKWSNGSAYMQSDNRFWKVRD